MSFQKITLTGLTLAALSACASQQGLTMKEQPKSRVYFDAQGNVVAKVEIRGDDSTGFIKKQDVDTKQPKPADSTNPYDVIAGKVVQPKEAPNITQSKPVDNTNPYDIISGKTPPKDQPKEQPKPLEQLKEPKYLPVALKASYSFEKDGFGAGTFYGIIKKNGIDMSKDKSKVIDIVINADQQPRDNVLSDKEMADYISRNKLTVNWVRDAPVYFEIDGSFEVEESQVSYFNALSKNNPAKVMYFLDALAAKKVDKEMVKTLEEKILK